MISALLVIVSFSVPATEWKVLQPGVSYGTLAQVEDAEHGDGVLHVVRIDPKQARLVVHTASGEGGKNRSAAQWSKDENLSVVINAGMYETNFSTHTGYLRTGPHTNNGTWVKTYRSLFVVKQDGSATVLDVNALPKNAADYDALAQNLRLIAAPGKNVWTQQPKRWSEAALALDARGRILFLFTRTPLSMHDLNEKLLSSELGIVRAQHLEGGPEASLSIHAAGVNLDLSGSYETGFNENDGSKRQWPLPNVIGVRAAR